ncbi:MAG: hypothetical protein JSV25_02310 [Spirochaetota bacterium]|nr:MAG: hypothetical protein JSV25_02310 [Spirochaetota bacterium]
MPRTDVLSGGIFPVKKLLFLPCLLLLFSYISAYSDEKVEDIYKQIEKMSKLQTPDTYRVTVENKSFSEALEELPADILTGGGEPRVVILFKKNDGVKIVIENIKEEYTSLFSMYEEYFKVSGISKVQNPIELREIIDKEKMSIYKVEKDAIVLQVWDPDEEMMTDNYAFFYLDRNRMVINQATYYLDGTPYMKAENSYKKYGKYLMPYKIVLTNMTDNSNDVFYFEDYKFNN